MAAGFLGISVTVIWLIILAVLIVIEIATLGLTTIWFAGGALAALLVSIAGGPFWLQILVFFAVSILLLIFTRPLAVKYLNKDSSKTNVESIPGETGVVIQKIDNLQAQGQVMVNGMEWTARCRSGAVIEEGKVVKVLAVEGVKLIVEEEA